MNLRNGIGKGCVCFVAVGCVGSGIISKEKADVPHIHQESQNPEGPTPLAMSVSRNGGFTTDAVTNVIWTTHQKGDSARSRK
jgi:hypothetical protein